MAHDLYICSSNRDKAAADAVCAALEASGLRCWIAPRDVPPGRAWAEAVLDAIAQSRLVVLIFSSRANESPHVKREVERIASIGIPLILFRIENVPPSNAFAYFLGSCHWLNAVTPPLDGHLQELVEAAHRTLFTKQPRPPETGTAPELTSATERDKYDAFISYRRESGAAEARLIRSELRERKVRAFLDVDDLKSGHFDEALLRRITAAPNFIVILSPHALDRCSDKRDWLRQEIAQAVKTRRNIIPILLRGFEFPDRESLPDDLKPLPTHNGLEYSHKYFNAMIADILSYLRAEDSLEHETATTDTPVAEQAISKRSDRVEVEASITDLTFRKLVDSPIALVGRKVGRYVIKELIGSGGSGFVYRALHPALGQDVCVKLFYPFKPEGEDAAGIVARGVRGLAAMNHPHIIKVFDFERFSLEDASSFYLVMELVRGRRLDEWSSSIAESGSTVSARLQMAVDITKALAAAHNCIYIDELGFERTGILHGDIKPGNIIVRTGNSPVVLDFMMLDVQRLLDPQVVPPSLLRGRQDQPITAAYGTPGFMAPEQDRDGIVTVKSDIYGLGVTLAHLFFPGADNPMLKVLVSDEDDQLNGLRSIVGAMVAEDPDARPRDMEEVAQRLTACAETLARDGAAATAKARDIKPTTDAAASRAAVSGQPSPESPGPYQPKATSAPATETSPPALVLPTVRVISPAGGERWQSGTTQEIKWALSSEGAELESIRIELDQKGSDVLTITAPPSHLPGSAVVFQWKIPTSLGATEDSYLVKVIARDKLGREGYAMSSAGFTITKMTEADWQFTLRYGMVAALGALICGGLGAIVGVSEFGSNKGGVKSPIDLVILIAIGVVMGGASTLCMVASRRGRLWGTVGIIAGLVLGAIWGDAEGFLVSCLLFGLLGSLFGAVAETQNRKSATKG